MPSSASAAPMLGKRRDVDPAHVQRHGALAALAQLGLDRQRHLVARRQLVHEALPVRVEQGGALAAHGLGDEEPVAGAVAHQRGGVELRELEVGEVGAGVVRERQADADGARAGWWCAPTAPRRRRWRAPSRARRSRSGAVLACGDHARRSGRRGPQGRRRWSARARRRARALPPAPASCRVMRRPVAEPPGVHDAARGVAALQAERERRRGGRRRSARRAPASSRTRAGESSHRTRRRSARAAPRPAASVSSAWRSGESSTASAAAMPPCAQ